MFKFYVYKEDPDDYYQMGLGDSLGAFFELFGITPWSYKLFKKKYYPWLKNVPLENIRCGCKKRERILNILFPYFWRNGLLD